jgi:hypothetical protein
MNIMTSIWCVYLGAPYLMQDLKRGYAFVFLKDPPNYAERRRCEIYVDEINGMYVPSSTSSCLHTNTSASLPSSVPSCLVCAS